MTSREWLHDLKYFILPGKPPVDFRHRSLHKETYKFWKSFWTAALERVEARPTLLRSDDFFRQEFIAVFLHCDQVIGLQAYTRFHLDDDATRNHSYFRKYFEEADWNRLNDLHLNHVMTMEYFSIDPEWRASRLKVSLGFVMAMLGLRLARAVDVEGVLTAARVEVSAANMAYELGATTLRGGLQIFGKATDLVYWTIDAIRPSRHIYENELAELFWSQRIDTTNLLPQNESHSF